MKTKAEFWRAWAIDGMPADKQRLAEAAWQAGRADRDKELREQEPAAWNFQHRETGRCMELTNDGINNPENFIANNPRFQLIGPLYTAPVPPPDVLRLSKELLAAMDEVDAEAQRADQPNANAWSSAPTVRMLHARKALAAALAKHRGQS
ncbi:hypothetical protein JN531_003980 [Flagellatimonas centrodinii]|uniref:hypothetical protein n=1 Tax=Flagellatimonas centrodinii TaxID=2806210 RepID=UPI001FED4FFD|nr:hypothetical protein [Flagellatimonas centrodinii]ULQ47446.1 hypothetical protein JN531_003980 [Flagellatimonas centrodinii]